MLVIIPKYQIGETLYMIPTKNNELKNIKEYTLLSISISDIGIRYELSLKKKEKGVEPFFSASEEMLNESIFQKKEEGEKKYKEKKK